MLNKARQLKNKIMIGFLDPRFLENYPRKAASINTHID
jgi:hypothetical protein